MYGDKGLSLKKRQPFCLTRNKFTTKTSRGCKGSAVWVKGK